MDNALDGWGASGALARKLKAKRMAKRRRPVIAAPPIETPETVDVFDPPSGIRAYRKFMPNLLYLGVLTTDRAAGTHVSLPYLSIMGRAP